MTASTELAEHIATVLGEDVPIEQRAQAKRLLLDYAGVTLAGSVTTSGRLVGELMESMGGMPESTVVGRNCQLPAGSAAYANAVSDHSIELDDVDELALYHFGPPVVSAALAVAERGNATGFETVSAIVLGCELMSRISRATNPNLRDRGFHTTVACGVFGAAAAAARLLGLDTVETTSALGLAGAHAGGLMEMYGPSMQKRINPASAARDGVICAQLAEKGYTGADTILEGERGFGAAFAGRIDVGVLLDGLGVRYPVSVEHKPYSAARPIHNAIDCARQLRRDVSGHLDQIEEITVWRHPAWAAYHLNSAPTSFHEAQVSLPYSVAVALRFDAALPEHYTQHNLQDETLRSLMQRVRAEPDPGLTRGVSCRMQIRTRDGRELSTTVDDPLGSQGNPMGSEALAAKFLRLAGQVLPEADAQHAAQLIGGLDELDSLTPLMMYLGGGAR